MSPLPHVSATGVARTTVSRRLQACIKSAFRVAIFPKPWPGHIGEKMLDKTTYFRIATTVWGPEVCCLHSKPHWYLAKIGDFRPFLALPELSLLPYVEGGQFLGRTALL